MTLAEMIEELKRYVEEEDVTGPLAYAKIDISCLKAV